MGTRNTSDHSLNESLSVQDIARFDPMLKFLLNSDTRDLKIDVDLAFKLQELYEDLANAYLGISELLLSYVVEQKAQGAILNSETTVGLDEREKYPS